MAMHRVTKDTGSPPLLFDRRRKILGIVNHRKSVTVDSLLSALPVSRMTISRDLESLETAGLLKRVRGGAVALSHIVVAPRASRSVRSLTEEQMRIGREASRRRLLITPSISGRRSCRYCLTAARYGCARTCPAN